MANELATYEDLLGSDVDLALPQEVKEDGELALSQEFLPTVLFYSQATKNQAKDDCDAAGVKLETFYLKEKNLGIRIIEPFRIVPTALFFDHWVKMDGKGNTQAVSLAQPPKEAGYFKQARLAVVLVADPDDKLVTPAIFSTVGPMTRLWGPIVANHQVAKSGEAWFRRGPAHAKTAKTPNPFFRYVATISAWLEESKTEGGNAYNLGDSRVLPASETLIDTLHAAFTPETQQKCIAAYESKVDWLKKKIVK